MATTLEALETRLAALEAEMAYLRARVVPVSADESAAERGARALAQARRDKVRLKALAAQVFSQLGAAPTPVPPEQLRAMMAADGIKAEDNLFSRGIQEMREE